MQSLIQIIIGSFLLSIVHASIPNHWLPIVAIGRSEKWSFKETLSVTALTGFAHTSSTILIGILVGFIGYRLSESYELITEYIAPSILIILGIVYLFLDYRENKNNQHHEHEHINVDEIRKRGNKKAIIASLSFAMFFSPCLEIEAYFFVASSQGWGGIAVVSIVYLTVTIIGMMLLVAIGSKSITKLKFHFFEHHEKALTGGVLLILGILSLLIRH